MISSGRLKVIMMAQGEGKSWYHYIIDEKYYEYVTIFQLRIVKMIDISVFCSKKDFPAKCGMVFVTL